MFQSEADQVYFSSTNRRPLSPISFLCESESSKAFRRVPARGSHSISGSTIRIPFSSSSFLAGSLGREDRDPTGKRFGDHQPEILAEGRKNEKVSLLINLPFGAVINRVLEREFLLQSLFRHHPFDFPPMAKSVRAHDPHAPSFWTDCRPGFHQVQEPFLGMDPGKK